jgi:hypothetical protein
MMIELPLVFLPAIDDANYNARLSHRKVAKTARVLDDQACGSSLPIYQVALGLLQEIDAYGSAGSGFLRTFSKLQTNQPI